VRRAIRILGTVLAVTGALMLIWAFVVWQWQDPFTALYTKWKQHELTSQYGKRARSFRRSIPSTSLAAERASIAKAARSYRLTSRRGQALGRIRIPRMGINMIFVNGTDHETLKKGPGRDLRTFMPGANRLVYIAGHRTTYLAPFSHIDSLRVGDRVALEVPYGTFIYSVTRHRVVVSTNLSVLHSPRHELLELQACHPRFFATHRYIAYAQLIRVEPRGATPYEPPALGAQTSGK
jgi:sortase A